MKAFIVIVGFMWFGFTMAGGLMVITSKKLWSTQAMPLRSRFDTQTIVGSLMLLSGLAAALAFFGQFFLN